MQRLLTLLIILSAILSGEAISFPSGTWWTTGSGESCGRDSQRLPKGRDERRERVKYTYDGYGQVTEAERRLMSGTEPAESDAVLPGQDFSYDYDLRGNHTAVVPLYDSDGNLTTDGLRTFEWDAENRLVRVQTRDDLPGAAPQYRVSYQYDDIGRRIAQTVEGRTAVNLAWIVAQRRAFLYDGWRCIAEFDYAPNDVSNATRVVRRSYVWGPDEGGGGGAGGLLMVLRHAWTMTGGQYNHTVEAHCATSDGNGNVTALISAANGTISAAYDYDAFGNVIRADGPMAWENPSRFSSQFTDDVTGLVYYGYRHYDPIAGRWLNRDPIGETGGANLYGFVGNDGVNGVDVLGLTNDLQGSEYQAGDALILYPPESANLKPVTLLLNGEGRLFIYVGGSQRGFQEITDEVAMQFPEIATHLPRQDAVSDCNCEEGSFSRRQKDNLDQRTTAQVGNVRGRGDRYRNGLGARNAEAWEAAADMVKMAITSEFGGRVLVKLIGLVQRANQVRKEMKAARLACASDVKIVQTGVPATANYAQTYYREAFSADGVIKLSEIAGRPIKQIDDLVRALESGAVKPSQIPVDIIRRGKSTLILNTRTSQALERAGIPRSQWKAVDRSGEKLFESLLDGQLRRNQLSPAGTPLTFPE